MKAAPPTEPRETPIIAPETSTDATSSDPSSTESPSSTSPVGTRDASQRRLADAPSRDQAKLVAEAALDKKAVNLRVLELKSISDFTDIFVICSGTNERQVQAIADSVMRTLRDHGVRPLHVEGYPNGRWVLLDYGGDMVVHVFHDETRRFYDLERLWSDAPDLTSELVEDPEAAAS